jgi:hypothetical protein
MVGGTAAQLPAKVRPCEMLLSARWHAGFCIDRTNRRGGGLGQVLHSVFATAPKVDAYTRPPVHPFAYPLVSFYIKEVHTEPAANEIFEVL